MSVRAGRVSLSRFVHGFRVTVTYKTLRRAARLACKVFVGDLKNRVELQRLMDLERNWRDGIVEHNAGFCIGARTSSSSMNGKINRVVLLFPWSECGVNLCSFFLCTSWTEAKAVTNGTRWRIQRIHKNMYRLWCLG